MIIFAADDPLVLDGTYDQEGYKPGERKRIEKSRALNRQQDQKEAQMAKKNGKTKKVKAPKKPTGRGQRSSAQKRNATRPAFRGADSRRRSVPRQPSLPGAGQVRDTKLDRICEDIGEGLDQITQGTEAVDEGKVAAGQRLHAKGLSGYRHAGVRVVLVPGAEKVSVKRDKDRTVTVAETAGETHQETAPGGDVDEGEDAGAGEPGEALDSE